MVDYYYQDSVKRKQKGKRETMSRTILAVLAAAIIMPAFNSCIFDADTAPPPLVPPGPTYLPLNKRDNVLHNLKTSYNQRQIEPYDQLLDDNFIFHFSQADFKDGNVSVAQWGRIDEIGTTANMFDPTYTPPDGSPISSINLTLEFPEGEDNWQAVTPPDPQAFPGETWYRKVVLYTLVVEAGEDTFLQANPLPALFIVRFEPAGNDTIYRIVAWHDDLTSSP